LETCALGGDAGNVYCFGSDERNIPTAGSYLVVDQDGHPLEDVAQVVVGYSWACALKKDGTVYCWGYPNAFVYDPDAAADHLGAFQVTLP
jgi:hypothetical protein